jgi:hypothetical protein
MARGGENVSGETLQGVNQFDSEVIGLKKFVEAFMKTSFH